MKHRKPLVVGEKFGKLTILEKVKPKSKTDKHAYYRTICDCGKERIVSSTYLRKTNFAKCKECTKFETIQNSLIKPGAKYGELTVIQYVGKKENDNHFNYLVKCECGNTELIKGTLLVTGKRKCCKDCSRKRSPQYKHGLTHTRLFNIWQGMRGRCYNKNEFAYKDYGGRGITICEEWKNDFISFYNWSMSNGYQENLSIDRINVNGNYEPSNCRWSDKITQANNTRTNRLLTYNGETHTMAEWSRLTGISQDNIYNRLRYGWSIEETLTLPVKH